MIFPIFLTMWLLCVIFVSVESVTHDIHRIVLHTTHYRPNRDHDYDYHNQKHYSTHGHPRKPVVHDSDEDDWSSESSTNDHHYHHSNNYRPSTKIENPNGYKRGKTRYHSSSTTKALNIAQLIELTTSYPEKLPVPIIEGYFQNYYQPPFPIINNSIDLIIPNESKKPKNTIRITYTGKTRHLREKELNSSRNFTKGYEVYEEIIGDISPPPLPDLKHNHNILTYPVLNTPIPIANTLIPPALKTPVPPVLRSHVSPVLRSPKPSVLRSSKPPVLRSPKLPVLRTPIPTALASTSTTTILEEEENHIKDNVPNVTSESETTTRAYGKRTKSRRHRGNIKA